ncbi:hypothetical protein T439DRAFT_380367 [Meredithblackwellia eburnea MCA 4105]
MLSVRDLATLETRDASSPISNPYPALINQVHRAFYPIPSDGFQQRLFVLLGLAAYVFLAAVTFQVLYTIALRRQGKNMWFWRFITKAEGKYIVACIYTASTTPSLLAIPFLGVLIGNTRDVYVRESSQKNTFVWRTLPWVIIWLQGWISSYANVQAVLITRTAKTSPRLPKLINAFYVGFPFVVITGMLAPGLMANSSWNYVYDRHVDIIKLLQHGSTYFQTTGNMDLNNLILLKSLQAQMETRLAQFYEEYYAMLVLWTLASLFLVMINLAGIVLVMRLRRQINGTPNLGVSSYDRDAPFTLERVTVEYNPKLSYGQSSGSAEGEFEDASDSSKFSFGSTPRLEAPAAVPAEHRSGLEDLSASSVDVRAMKKLIRDLIITIATVIILALTFSADTILLAVKRHNTYSQWATAEVGVTLTIWAYLIFVGVAMTFIAVNEAVFLFSSHPGPISNPGTTSTFTSSPRETEEARRRVASMAEAVFVTTQSHVVIESEKEPVSPTSSAPQTPRRSSLRKSARVPVPPFYPDNLPPLYPTAESPIGYALEERSIVTSMGDAQSMVTAPEEQSDREN